MICKWCGNSIPASATKCKRCGKEVPAMSNCGGFYDLVSTPANGNQPQTPAVQPGAPEPIIKTPSLMTLLGTLCIIVLVVLVVILFVKNAKQSDQISQLQQKQDEHAQELYGIDGKISASYDEHDASISSSFITATEERASIRDSLSALETEHNDLADQVAEMAEYLYPSVIMTENAVIDIVWPHEEEKPSAPASPEDEAPEDEAPEDEKSEDEKPEDEKPEDEKPEEEKPEATTIIVMSEAKVQVMRGNLGASAPTWQPAAEGHPAGLLNFILAKADTSASINLEYTNSGGQTETHIKMNCTYDESLKIGEVSYLWQFRPVINGEVGDFQSFAPVFKSDDAILSFNDKEFLKQDEIDTLWEDDDDRQIELRCIITLTDKDGNTLEMQVSGLYIRFN